MDKEARGYTGEVAEFCREAEKAVGVPLNVEGKYRWIVFLPSKIRPDLPVLNRYYGVFEDGRIKMRGIEARRTDTPQLIKKAPTEMIKALSIARDEDTFMKLISQTLEILKGYAERLLDGKTSIQELIITKRLSKHPSEYAHDVFQAIAAKKLMAAGFDVYPGQTVEYIIVDADNRSPSKRVRAALLISPNQRYDIQKYLEMLLEAGESLLNVFGYDIERIRREAIYSEKQLVLN